MVEQTRPVMEGIGAVFTSYAPSDNEAQTEEDLVRPVLRLLGHDFEVQPALETPDGTRRSDYVLLRHMYGPATEALGGYLMGCREPLELTDEEAVALSSAFYGDLLRVPDPVSQVNRSLTSAIDRLETV
ncbi:MAG: hypothetical protein ACRDTR_09520, partial [Rubrobacter sp.]